MPTEQNDAILNITSNSLLECLFHYAKTTPTHDAVVTPCFSLSYAQLTERVQAQVVVLNNLGVSSNSVIGIRCTDDAQHLVLCLATSYIGATSCTIPSYEDEEIQKVVIKQCCVTLVLDNSHAVDLTTSADIAEIRSVEKPVAQASLLFSTSGTTGEPKLVEHYDSDIVEQAHRHISSKQERFTCRASMEHNFAKRHRLYCVAMGATNVFLSENLASIVTDCRALKVNVIHLSSFQAQELLNQPGIGKLPSLRLKLGGSHIPSKLRAQLRASITDNFQAGYGTTETGAIAFTDPRDADAGESVGKALPGIEVRCVDGQRNPVNVGERGELAIRAKGMFRAYRGKPEMTSQRLQNGWFYTGDIGYIDDQHRLYLVGRSDDMFMFNSMNIYPQDIESEIRRYPGVTDAVVLPKESIVHGQIPVALVVFNQHLKPDLSRLRKFVKKRVGVRSPKQYTVVDEIPTTMSGKISRIEASKLTKKSEKIRQEIMGLLDDKHTQHIKSSQISDFIEGKRDLSFGKLQMDSLSRMDLLVSLETQYDIVITPQELALFRTLGKLSSRVLTGLKQELVKQQDQQHYFSGVIFDNVEQADEPKPYIVRFFQRLYSYCETVARLNQVFANLEHRLTPCDVACLDYFHEKGLLIPHNSAIKFQSAVSFWLNETKKLMLNSGKSTPESFVVRNIAPGMLLFSDPKKTTEKTLLIGLPPRGVRHLMMPSAVLLQHIDSAKYDLLMISGAKNGGYQFGTFPFGRVLHQQAQWLTDQEWFKQYKRIRTLGFSAGSFPAIALGYLLNAELALSIAGRFHKKKHPLINLDKITTMWGVLRKGRCDRVLISYSADNVRDQQFARFFTKVCKAKEIRVTIKTEKLPHLMLRRLAERGELATYFDQTLFAEPDNVFFNDHRKKELISFPLFQENS